MYNIDKIINIDSSEKSKSAIRTIDVIMIKESMNILRKKMLVNI